MPEEERERPTVNHPLNAPRRTALVPILIVVGILALGVAVWLLTSWLRYNT